MLRWIALLVLCVLMSCSTSDNTENAVVWNGAKGLPSPSELALEPIPTRQASGVLSGDSRIIQIRGDQVPMGQPSSNNATPNPDDFSVELTGVPGELSFIVYRLDPLAFNADDTLTEMRVSGSLASGGAVEGLWIAYPNYETDSWDFYELDNLTDWVEISGLGIQGADDRITPFAILLYGEDTLTLRDIYLRFATTATIAGDEWIYFDQLETPGLNNRTRLMRIQPDGSGLEQVVENESEHYFGRPYVVRTLAGHQLMITRQRDMPMAGMVNYELYRCELDGSGLTAELTSVNDTLSAGASRGGDRQYWLERDSVTGNLAVHVEDYEEATTGRISNPNVKFLEAVSGFGNLFSPYQALGALEIDPGERHIVTVTSVTIAEATAVELYNRVSGEDAINPSLMILLNNYGEEFPYYWFASAGRDHVNYGIYYFGPQSVPAPDVYDRIARATWSASKDVTAPVASPDCTQLAMILSDPGAAGGSLSVRRLFQSGAPIVPLAEDVVNVPAWYDPTP